MAERRYGSDLMVDAIRACGFRYASLNPGSSFRGLHDSIVNYAGNSPEIICCPHEEVAVGMAHGYAKAGGEPMAVILHDVVGLLHGAMAVYYAYLDRVPMVIFGGSGPMDSTRRRPQIDWIHSANVQANAVRDFTKWDTEPHSLRAVPEAVARAFRVAMTEPRGPVYVALDAGLQEDPVDDQAEMRELGPFTLPSPIGPDPGALRALAEMLVGAERPIVLPGYVGRHPESFGRLVELAELLGMGVIDTHLRLNFPTGHPLNVTGSDAIEEADLVFLLDLKDPGRLTQDLDSATRTIRSRLAPGAKVASLGFHDLGISSWSQDFGAFQPADLEVTADAAVALSPLLELCRTLQAAHPEQRVARRRWEQRLEELHRATRARWEREASEGWDASPISTARLAAEVWQVVKEHDWVLTAGTAGGWALRTWDFDRPHRYPGASLGTATQIAIALGVALASRGSGRLVVDLQPDGDLLYDLGALWVAAHYRIPLLVVMFNNRAYYNDWEHQERMARQRGRPVENARLGMELDRPPPDFAGIARSMGWFAEGPITEPGHLGKAVRRGVEVVTTTGQPALVDVVCRPR